MLRSMLVAAVLGLFVAVPGIANATVVDDTDIVLTVQGFDCEMCAAKLQRGLAKMEGVTAVDTEKWSEGLVTVRVAADADVSDEELRKTVEKAGFVLAEVRRGGADTAAAETGR